MSIGVSTIHFRNTAPKRYRAEPNRAARGGGKGGGGGVEGGMGSGGWRGGEGGRRVRGCRVGGGWWNVPFRIVRPQDHAIHSSLILDLGCMRSVAGTRW